VLLSEAERCFLPTGAKNREPGSRTLSTNA